MLQFMWIKLYVLPLWRTYWMVFKMVNDLSFLFAAHYCWWFSSLTMVHREKVNDLILFCVWLTSDRICFIGDTADFSSNPGWRRSNFIQIQLFWGGGLFSTHVLISTYQGCRRGGFNWDIENVPWKCFQCQDCCSLVNSLSDWASCFKTLCIYPCRSSNMPLLSWRLILQASRVQTAWCGVWKWKFGTSFCLGLCQLS